VVGKVDPKIAQFVQSCEAAAISETLLVTSLACFPPDEPMDSLRVAFMFIGKDRTNAQYTEPLKIKQIFSRSGAFRPRSSKVERDSEQEATSKTGDDGKGENGSDGRNDGKSSVAVVDLPRAEDTGPSSASKAMEIGCDRWLAVLQLEQLPKDIVIESPYALMADDVEFEGMKSGITLETTRGNVPLVTVGKKKDFSAYLMTASPGASAPKDFSRRRGAPVTGQFRDQIQSSEDGGALVLKGILLDQMSQPVSPSEAAAAGRSLEAPTLEVGGMEGCVADLNRLKLETSFSAPAAAVPNRPSN
jgi:hypothetical protein